MCEAFNNLEFNEFIFYFFVILQGIKNSYDLLFYIWNMCTYICVIKCLVKLCIECKDIFMCINAAWVCMNMYLWVRRIAVIKAFDSVVLLYYIKRTNVTPLACRSFALFMFTIIPNENDLNTQHSCIILNDTIPCIV